MPGYARTPGLAGPWPLPLELAGEGGRGTGQPAVGECVAQRPGGDPRQLDQHGRVPVEVRDGEEGVRVGGEHCLLFTEVLGPDGQDWAVRRHLVAEPADVRLAERPVPG